ncbi:cytochrome P450 [Nocardia arizonensis]|uniref:cytochrome P450 n=1 Tax=Nocardia arizonensis TaxID=1141647 RepID=UPI0006D0DF43|nr:cytochrome P450 [Nocardia arizonensis]
MVASPTSSAPTARPPAAPAVPDAVVTPEEFGVDGYSLAVIRVARRLGPIFRWRLSDDYAPLFISSRDLVTDVCDDRRFGKDLGAGLRFARDYAGEGLFTAYTEEPNWAKAHHILLPAFALDAMRNYHGFMLAAAGKLLRKWDDMAAVAPVDVAGDLTKMTLDTIGLAGFGYDFDSFARDEPHPFVGAMNGALTYSRIRVNWAPGEEHPAETARYRTDCDTMATIVDEVIDARRASTDPGPGDLLDLMLTSRYPRTGELLDLVNVRHQVISFLIAGHETTSGLLSFALYYLMKNPAVLHLAQQEVDAVLGSDPNPAPTYAQVRKLTYIRQILHEALRLWPTAPSFDRRPLRDTVLAGLYPVEEGQTISVVTAMLHRDPVWGDNVELFDPARFTPERIAARPPDSYKPFGTGLRACIGQQFALHEGALMLGLLVHRYHFLDHADYTLNVQQTLTLKPVGFTMTLRRRTDRVAAGAGDKPSATTTSAVAAGTPLTILHGSNLGTGVQHAEDLADAFESLGYTPTVAALDTAAGALPGGDVLVVAASYNGHPTDDAKKFLAWLDTAEAGAAAQVRYAVLGLGDRNWASTYQRVPRLIDAGLARAGATRLADLTEVDVSMGGTDVVERFTERVRARLDGANPAAETTARRYRVTEVDPTSLRGLRTRHGLETMTVTAAHSLVREEHAPSRAKRLVRVALPAGTTYRSGDHFTLLPANGAELVERAAAAFGVDLDTVLHIAVDGAGRNTVAVDGPVDVHTLLTHHVELQDPPTARQLRLLAAANPCPPERDALVEHAESGSPAGVSLVAVFERYRGLTGRVDWDLLLTLLPPMRLRHYSISSSPAASPEAVELMVSLLTAPHAGAPEESFTGVASRYLHELTPGARVSAKVTPCRDSFRITDHERTPIIMVAAGTGLAPFRAAIADRVALRGRQVELPPAICYFGCDAPDLDYLHAAELTAAEDCGAVSMRPTFARAPERGWTYVQDRIAAEGAQLWPLLAAGAKVYVCGDAKVLAPAVRRAFVEVMLAHTSATVQEAETWWQGLVSENRYVEDVFSSRDAGAGTR